MPVRRKMFRIEDMQSAGAPVSAAEMAPLLQQQQQYILAELTALRGLLEEQRPDGASKIDADGTGDHKIGGSEANRLQQLKSETNTIHRAISHTKHEIAALHVNGLNAPESGRVIRELDAVVGGAERAIQQILAAAEDIDDAANTLSATLKREQERALTQDIRDQVIRIFEACNFQDLAGQRISKVLATLKFVEDHTARMMEIWGGIEAFQDYTAAALAERGKGSVPLNGPKLDGDSGHVSQDDVDKLFSGQ